MGINPQILKTLVVFKISPVDHELELADNAEVVDCDYNAEVEYSACLISMFCLNYVIALLSRLKNPSMGRSVVVWQEGQSSCKFQSLPKSLSRC